MQNQGKGKEQVESGGKAEELRRLGFALRARLYFHQHCGIQAYPAIAAVPSASSMTEKGQDQTGNQQDFPEKRRNIKAPVQAYSPQPRVVRNLDEVHAAVRACQRCPTAASSCERAFGLGRKSARLMVVGDYAWQTGSQDGHGLANYEEGQDRPLTLCFGEAEDQLLWKMLQSIQLRPQDVYVTNALKCLPEPGQKPDDSSLRQCQQHLLHEISAVRPRLICAMGESAASMLIGGREPVARLRGRIHSLQAGGEAMAQYKVMVTYHPRFLLKVEDMKRAAWEDLLRMQELLGKRGSRNR